MAHPFSLNDIPRNTVILVAGPTASGKSDWALHHACSEASDFSALAPALDSFEHTFFYPDLEARTCVDPEHSSLQEVNLKSEQPSLLETSPWSKDFLPSDLAQPSGVGTIDASDMLLGVKHSKVGNKDSKAVQFCADSSSQSFCTETFFPTKKLKNCESQDSSAAESSVSFESLHNLQCSNMHDYPYSYVHNTIESRLGHSKNCTDRDIKNHNAHNISYDKTLSCLREYQFYPYGYGSGFYPVSRANNTNHANTVSYDPYRDQTAVCTGRPKTSSRIINGDSLQVYRGLDLLTAMPSPHDQNQMNHDLYGFLSPYAKSYDVAQWMGAVDTSVNQAIAWGQRPWIVGGTGFYLKTLTEGLSPIPTFSVQEKEFFRREYQVCSRDDLKKILMDFDPVSADKIDDKQRLLHALITYRLTGKALSWWHTQKRIPSALKFFCVLIWPTRERLLDRAAQRWDKMVERGVYDEVRRFCNHPQWHTATLRYAIGLHPIYEMLNGNMTQSQCRQAYLTAIAQYAKKQRTWFRGQFVPDYVYDSENSII